MLDLFLCLGSALLPGLAEIRPGETIEGEITVESRSVVTDALRASGAAERAERLHLVVGEESAVSIELTSFYFDAYLVVRDEAGRVVDEDDDGLLGTHARVVLEELAPGDTFLIEACALSGETGRFRLAVRVGRPPATSPRERREAFVADAEARVLEMRGGGEEARPRLASTLEHRGDVLSQVARYAQALESFREALAIREDLHGPEDIATLSVQNRIGVLLTDLGRHREARPVLEELCGRLESVFGPRHPDTATGIANLAYLLDDMGDYERAIELYERALAIDEEVYGPRHPETATCLNNLGAALIEVGPLDRARELLERALSIREETLGRDDPVTSTTANNLALALQRMGNTVEALPLYERALETLERERGPGHPETIKARSNLGYAWAGIRRYDQSLPIHQETLAAAERVYDEDHLEIALGLTCVGTGLWATGRADEALPLFERALDIRERALPDDHPLVSGALHNLASALLALGEVERAKEMLERSAAIEDAARGDRVANNVSHKSLARILADRGEMREAWRLCMDALDSSTELLEISRLAAEWERVRAMGEFREDLALAVSLASHVDSDDAGRSTYEEVLNWKGLASRGLLESHRRVLASLDDGARDLLADLRRLKRELSDVAYSTSFADADVHERRLRDLRERRGSLERELLARVAESGGEPRLTVDELREALPPKSAFVDFFSGLGYEPGAKGERGRWMEAYQLQAWITRPDVGLVRLDLGDLRVVEGAAREFLARVTAGGGNLRGIAAESSIETGFEDVLRARFWEPIARHLDGVELVFVSPDHFLGAVPFGILPTADGRYPIEDRSFAYVSSGGELSQILARSAGSKFAGTLLAVGDVDYGATGSGGAGAGGRRWDPLPFTGPEAKAVASVFPSTEGTLVLSGGDADEERLRRELPSRSWIHLATHGFFQPEGLPSSWDAAREIADGSERRLREVERVGGLMPGLLSGLVCSGANASSEAGLLTAEEVTWLDLTRCELVVLSACETGLGTMRGGEGMASLQRSFRLAGARSVVSSLWSVDDASTAALMSDFYRRLWIEDRPRGAALREAKLALLEAARVDGGDGAPFLWGGFVLSGDWR